MTFPEQPLPPGLPPQPKQSKKQLLIGLAAGIAIGLVLGCCGGVAISMNAEKSDDPKPAAATTSEPAEPSPSSASPTPAEAPTIPAEAPPTPSESASPTAVPETNQPTLVAMPNVVGQNAAVAADELRRLGFENIQYGSQDKNATVVVLPANWTVTKQSAKAGTKVPVDALIVLTCVKN